MMPDASRECETILEQLREIRDMHIEHSSAVKVEILHIKTSLARIEAIETAIEQMKLGDARHEGKVDGMIYALAKVGAFVVAVFGAIGWLATGGRWEWIKEHVFR
jgi:hypothetical protein